MSLKETVIARKENYLHNIELRKQNKFIGIPLFKKFPRFGKYIPAIPPAAQIMLTANSGVGKTQSWIGIILIPTYELIKEEGLKVKFLINLLEDPIDLFIDRLFSAVLFRLTGIVADGLALNSIREDILNGIIVSKLNEIEATVTDILSYCEVNESIMNPTGIYKWCRNKANDYGEHVYTEKTFKYTNDDNTIREEKVNVYSHYTAKDDTQIIVIIDNLNNLSLEGSLNQLQTINKWTRDYGRLQITKHWKWTIVNILQQSSDSEKQEYYKGETMVDKIEPSLDGLGNSKECQRDHLLILGLFAPARYGIKKYFEYDITKLEDNFRSLKILKSNISDCNKRIPFYFNGACSYFSELPKVGDITEETYKNIREGKYK